MKKVQFSPEAVSRIRKTWLEEATAITCGPNKDQLTESLFKGKEIFFWLDDSVKAIAVIEGIKLCLGDETRNSVAIKGRIKPFLSEKYLFSFEMHYDSYRRQGSLTNGVGFVDLKILN